ncbi:hypothetical protein JCM11251_005323 [Rhodosporidiobolus azoricus]
MSLVPSNAAHQSKTTTPTFNQVFAAYKWCLIGCANTGTIPIPLGDFAIACFAYLHLKARGHLRPVVEDTETADVEHAIRQLQVFLYQPGGGQPHIPQALMQGNYSRMRGSTLLTNIPVPMSAVGTTPSPPAAIHAKIHLSHMLISELIPDRANMRPLLCCQSAETTSRVEVWQFKAIVLLLLELLAWHDDRNDRHLLNIKVLFEAEAESKVHPDMQVPHESLSGHGIAQVAHSLHDQALAVAIETADLVASKHFHEAAIWEHRNMPGLSRVVNLQTLTERWKNVLSEVRVLLQIFPQWPAHLRKYPTAHDFSVAHHLNLSDYLHEEPQSQEHAMGKMGRRSRRRSFGGGRNGW